MPDYIVNFGKPARGRRGMVIGGPMARKAVKKAAPRKAASRKGTARKTTAKKAPAKSAAPSRSIKVATPAGKTVTQSALLQIVADHAELPRAEAKRFVEAYLDVVKAHVLKGAKVKLGDIGMIMIRARKARMGRNPQTGEPVKIKASKKLAFRQSATMREMVR
ncbi:MAG: HU family DNA-binding protein [Alphaproteobacteria bacterium]|nr:HU family DNA-binding protein [Alphaproteobacteria bacterium]